MDTAGHLATIHSPAENQFIYDSLGFSALQYPDSFPWIGGFQPAGSAEPAGNFQWVTGEPFNYTNWAPPAEPNNVGGNEDVVQINGNPVGAGRWNDNTRTRQFSYIVEYPTGTLKPSSARDPVFHLNFSKFEDVSGNDLPLLVGDAVSLGLGEGPVLQNDVRLNAGVWNNETSQGNQILIRDFGQFTAEKLQQPFQL